MAGQKIPFSMLPPDVAAGIAKRFVAVGNILLGFAPFLKAQLQQTDIKYTPREYATISVIVSVTNALVVGLFIFLLGILARTNLAMFALGAAAILGFASFASVFFYPRIISTRRVRAIDNNLVPALRQMLIELRSGVSLFEAMKSISGGYGAVSAEFKNITDRIEGGIAEIKAINDASARNPSFRFRRALWQISNSLSVGADVTIALEDMIADLTKEKMDDIRRYGQELNPWTMMYMMVAVIVPSLGVSMMSILLSFLNLPIPKIIYPGIIAGLILFQIFFISFVRSRRPVVD